MDVTEISIVHHIGIVIASLWILSWFDCCHTIFYFVFFVYLYLVNERYNLKLRKRLQFEERKQANQRRLLSDSETVRWLNHAVEKVWPICMEQIASQKILLPIVPWFLEKYKPWTASKALVQHMYLGRNPPMFTEIRVLGQSADDDHLVLELGMNFLSADDMSTILAVKLKKRFGFGIWAKLHVTGMHVEGKVLVGVKFLREWPFLGRLRVCFVEPPYFQMTVKPIFNHGLDVAELPGIAGWMDKLLSVAFGQTLVEPNMLVVDVEKFVSVPTESWFSVNEKRPIAFAKVEIVEAADMKPSDPNGLADPYVKGQLGPYRFRTKIQKKTLTPKWQEEYKIPVCSWESPNVLVLEVRDKDHFLDDILGDCSIDVNNLRGEKRHDIWLPLQNIKMGRLHLAITVLEANAKVGERASDEEPSEKNENMDFFKVNETSQHNSISTSPSQPASKMADEFEPINVEGQQQTGIWVHHPGSDVSQKWEPRKGKIRRPETQLYSENDDSIGRTGVVATDSINDENSERNQVQSPGMVQRSLRKISSIFQKSPGSKDPESTRGIIPSPRVNLRPVDEKVIGVKLVVDGNNMGSVIDQKDDESSNIETSETASPGKRSKKGMAMGILKQAATRSAHSVKHVLSKKGSDKSRSSSMGDGELSRGSSSSDRESLVSSKEYSPKVVGTPTDSDQPIGEFPSAKEGHPSEESLVRKISLRDVDRTDDEQAAQVEVVEGSSSPKGCERGNLEVAKEE